MNFVANIWSLWYSIWVSFIEEHFYYYSIQLIIASTGKNFTSGVGIAA